MRALLISIFLTATTAHAQTIVKGKLLKEVAIEGKPSFFFKIHGSGRFISYSLANDPNRPAGAGTNHLLELATGSLMTIPGPWDPVFVANSNYMILPRGTDASYINYELRDLNKLLRNNPTSHIGDVPNVTGLYQSVGVLSTQGPKTKIRLIAEDGYRNHKVKDFTYNSATNSLNVDQVGVTHKLCSNQDLKLPMLSKDGQFLGGLDLKTKKSAIWKINPDFTCDKVLDLSLKTGKLNFSYDSTKVTYHVYGEPVEAKEDAAENYIPIPSDSFVSDVYVLDLRTKVTTRVTSNRETNSMYPDFTADGQLVFINHHHDDARKVTFSFLRL